MIPQLQGMGFPELAPIADDRPRPFWSVVIPVHNRTKYLAQCVASAVQAIDAEIIIVNSGGDESAIIRAVPTHGSDLKVISFPDDLGAIRNWNRAIGLTRGRWVFLLHDDDYVMPGFFERLQDGIESARRRMVLTGDGHPSNEYVGIASTGYENEDGNGNVNFRKRIAEDAGILPAEEWQRRIGIGNVLNPPAVVVARKTYEDIGIYHPDLTFVPDWEFYKRAACFVPWWSEPALLARYRVHDQSGTLTADLVDKYRTIRMAIEMSERYYPPAIAEEVSRNARRHWLKFACCDAMGQADKGNDELAWQIMGQARALMG